MTHSLTLATIKSDVKAMGLRCTRIDGEYRIAFPNDEDSAYYTTDAVDALNTACAMAAHKDRALAFGKVI